MNRKSIYLLIFSFFLLLTPLFGQTYATGALFDPVKYGEVVLQPRLVTRNYTSIPQSYSLLQYSPIPETQNWGTCAAWSTVFAARTISESIALDRTNQVSNSNNVFSPYEAYLGTYRQVGWFPNGFERSSFFNILSHLNSVGKEGAYIVDVLEYLKKSGAVKRNHSEKDNSFPSIYLSTYINEKRYQISDYVRLFDFLRNSPVADKVIPVKKSISEGKPVIIAMLLPPSFFSFYSKGELWRPYENPNSFTLSSNNYHAMCVVGYDDKKHGGAILIQNSWGTGWGSNGYVWVTYNDFAIWVYEAYEMKENLSLYKDATRYAASININVFNDNRGMPVTFDKQGFYKTQHSYRNGTLFQFQMTNKYPSYVYAFSADNKTSEIVRVFPEKGVSPVLDYTDSTVAWPDENTGMVLDGNADTHYLVVLYSKQALDISVIEQRFAREKGTFPERVAKAVGSSFIPYKAVQYSNDKIEFSTVSTDPKSVFGLLLAINHQTR